MTYSESELIIPTLNLLLEYEAKGLTTSELIKILMDQLDLSEDDLKTLSGRSDTHFSQKVRNLVSHDTLLKKDLITYKKQKPSGLLKITEDGKKYLSANTESLQYLNKSGFSETQRKKVIKEDLGSLVIEEGYLEVTSPKEKKKRSRKLTQLAREHYSENGKIKCSGCNFDFDTFYGPTAKSYIEIHHLKPISTYGEKDISKKLAQALADVRPLCSNCHRMVHRNKDNLLSINELQELVKQNGKFELLKG